MQGACSDAGRRGGYERGAAWSDDHGRWDGHDWGSWSDDGRRYGEQHARRTDRRRQSERQPDLLDRLHEQSARLPNGLLRVIYDFAILEVSHWIDAYPWIPWIDAFHWTMNLLEDMVS
jgi:hypothetical protein